MVIKSPRLAGIYEKPANLGFFLFLRVLVANQRVFGKNSAQVIERYRNASYDPMEYYKENEKIKKAVDFITSEQMLKIGQKENLERLKNELITKDWFMTFPDFESYCETKDKALSDYENKLSWAKKMLINIANAGYFSSDRTIEEYNTDIWHLDTNNKNS